MKSNLRLTSDPQEILANLELIKTNKNVMTIWQHAENGEEVESTDAVISTIQNKTSIIFEIINSPLPLRLNDDIYFLIKEFDILFKSNLLKQNMTIIQTTLPENMRLTEKRSGERIKFKFKENKSVEINFLKKDKNPFMVTTNILNISDTGACFVVSKDTLSKIDPEKPIEMNSLCSSINFKKTKALLRNVRKFKSKSITGDDMFAIGVEFI